MTDPDFVAKLVADYNWYHWNWILWTGTDWSLTLLSAGTAIAAAVKNAVAARPPVPVAAPPIVGAANAAQPNVAAPAQGQVPKDLDKWVMYLAAISVAATVLSGKMHPDVQADRYWRGHLVVQDALMHYAASDKSVAANDLLVARWQKAQDILEGQDRVTAADLKLPQTAGADSKTVANPTPETKKDNPVITPAPFQKPDPPQNTGSQSPPSSPPVPPHNE